MRHPVFCVDRIDGFRVWFSIRCDSCCEARFLFRLVRRSAVEEIRDMAVSGPLNCRRVHELWEASIADAKAFCRQWQRN